MQTELFESIVHKNIIERNQRHLQESFNNALKTGNFDFWRFIRNRWHYVVPMETNLTEDQRESILEDWYSAAYWLLNELDPQII